MKKRLAILGLSALMSLSTFFTVFAAWENQNNIWKYQESASSYAKNKWLKLDDFWYHFDDNGNMQTGWINYNDKWYYMDSVNGFMKTGWFIDGDGKWYYLDKKNGDMLANKRTPDGYYVDKSGVYDASKGRNTSGNNVGPGSFMAEEKKRAILKGVEFPSLESFATSNLSGDNWGISGSQESMQALSAAMGNSIQIDGTTIIYNDGGGVKLKLLKSGDHYELHDYGSIDSDMETVMMGMFSMISSQPQKLFNAIYMAAEYDQTVMRSENYTAFGDSNILYTVHDGYVSFSILEK